MIEGPATAVSAAFDVDVHDYRSQRGQLFYAAPQQPAVPPEVAAEVAELGRVLSYTPRRESRPPMVPAEVPEQGLSPSAVLRTYNIAPLRDAGYTGKGSTVVVFAFDGFDQPDLDSFSSMFNLPAFTPEVVGGLPANRSGEATMDLEVAHAIAPDATMVLYNARPTVEAKAQANGTTAFDASGDLAGLECKGGSEWSSPPHADNVGLDAVASMPEMTNVGGTTLSTDADGRWLAEQAWVDAPLSQGTAGGVSALFARPQWQGLMTFHPETKQRLTPDISAVADPFTGLKIVVGQNIVVGGGTSQAAPLWAGFTAVMNQYLKDNGGRNVGDLNPLLYQVMEGSRLPAFRDIVLGGNAVASAGPGYDLATGLGTPDVDNLVRNILVLQKLLP